MAYSQTRIENTVPIGGNLRMRVEEIDISNYDDDGSGDGEPFAPVDIHMRRFTFVLALVSDASGVTANYDEANNAVRLYQQANDGSGTTDDSLTEVPSNSNEGATVKLICVGV